MSQYRKIWNKVKLQLFEKPTTGPSKNNNVYRKLIIWKKHINISFHGQDIPQDIYCNATPVLKIDSVYKQGKNYYPQIYVEECKYTDSENRQCNMLSDAENDDGFFGV